MGQSKEKLMLWSSILLFGQNKKGMTLQFGVSLCWIELPSSSFMYQTELSSNYSELAKR